MARRQALALPVPALPANVKLSGYIPPKGVYLETPKIKAGINPTPLILGAVVLWLLSHPTELAGQVSSVRVALAAPTQALAKTPAGQAVKQ